MVCLMQSRMLGVVVRPFIDSNNSDFEKIGTTAVYSVAFFRSLIVSSTDANKGWPEPRLIDEDDRGRPTGKLEKRYAEFRETEIGTLKANGDPIR